MDAIITALEILLAIIVGLVIAGIYNRACEAWRENDED